MAFELVFKIFFHGIIKTFICSRIFFVVTVNEEFKGWASTAKSWVKMDIWFWFLDGWMDHSDNTAYQALSWGVAINLIFFFAVDMKYSIHLLILAIG